VVILCIKPIEWELHGTNGIVLKEKEGPKPLFVLKND
tara:strand:+ start:1893 stop:2003 length:111 start_codon:yes stop_codon:yes gene_type:complete